MTTALKNIFSKTSGMKIKLFLLFVCAIGYNLTKAQNEEVKYLKTEDLLKFMGNIGYSGWFFKISYYVNSKKEVVSDTTFSLMTNPVRAKL